MRTASVLLVALVFLAAIPATADAGRCGKSGFSISIGTGYGCGYRGGFSYRSRGYCGSSYRHHGYRHCRSVQTYRNCGSFYGGSVHLAVPRYSYRSCGPTYSYRSSSAPAYAPTYVVTNPAYDQPAYQAEASSSGDSYREWQLEQRVAQLERQLANQAAQAEAERRSPIALAHGAEAGADGWDEDEPFDAELEAPAAVGRTDAVDAWAALDDGNYAEARDRFTALLDLQPTNAAARVGLALSWAWLGEELTASFEMTRALRNDPFAVADAVGFQQGRSPALLRLARLLRSGTTTEMAQSGRWTLIAAVEYLAGERPEAQASIKRARRFGESDQGAKNLWRLLGLSDKAPEAVADT